MKIFSKINKKQLDIPKRNLENENEFLIEIVESCQ